MISSKERVIQESLKQKYGDYAMVFCLKRVENHDYYLDKITAIFESIRMVENVQVNEIDDRVFVLFYKIKSSQRSWIRFVNSLANCFKGIKKDDFVRIQLLKDVHINDNVLKSGTCVFDQFSSNGSLFQKEILANLLLIL